MPLGLGVFLVAMDQTVVASSFASIGNDMHQLQSTAWVATGYMLTLTSFQYVSVMIFDYEDSSACFA